MGTDALSPTLDEALRHIDALTGDQHTPVTLQFFDDTAKDGCKAAIRHGTVTNLWQEVVRRQTDGAGVFVTVNETNLRGRTEKDITAGRAVWGDDDTVRDAIRRDWPIDPHIVIESSPGKFHYYWRTISDDFDQLEKVVAAISANHGTDKSAGGRNRVLRLAGTLHLKNPKTPFLVQIVEANKSTPYSWDRVVNAFPPSHAAHNSENLTRSMDDAELLTVLQTCGDGMHDALLTLSARWATQGAGTELIALGLRGAMGTGDGTERWAARFAEIPRIAQTAFAKYAAFDDRGEPVRGEALAPIQISLADVLSNPPAAQRYAWAGRVPMNAVTLLGAHGGTGKSTFALQLCAHVADGSPFLGFPVERGRAVFFSAEDSAPVIRRRFASICAAHVMDPTATAAQLIALDATHAPTLYREMTNRTGRKEPLTAVYRELRDILERDGVKLLVIDNASDVFDADEIDRARVREFVRSLAAIANDCSCAVLLLVHVAKDTARQGNRNGGENYSGSTAWHNSARSRFFMCASEGAANVLQLTHEKNNYGMKEAPLLLSFTDMGTLGLYADPMNSGRSEAEISVGNQLVIVKLVRELYERGDYASPSMTSSTTNAHAVLRREFAYPKGLTKDACLRLVRSAEATGWLKREEYRNKERKLKERWSVTPIGVDAIAAGDHLHPDECDLFV